MNGLECLWFDAVYKGCGVENQNGVFWLGGVVGKEIKICRVEFKVIEPMVMTLAYK